MACPFCATGQGGLTRNLSTAEIVEQVRVAARAAADRRARRRPGRLSNVVFMGMGEPLANYNRIAAALHRLIDPAPAGFGLSRRSITVSTVGLVPAIDRLADEDLDVTLAVSLHAPDDELRDTLVPVNTRWKVAEVLAAADDYAARTGRRYSIEYAMIRDVNDQPWRADLLGDLLAPRLAHVNLIPLNPTPGSQWDASPKQVEREFVRRLEARGVPVTVRDTRGRDIDGACGQLAAQRLRPRLAASRTGRLPGPNCCRRVPASVPSRGCLRVPAQVAALLRDAARVDRTQSDPIVVAAATRSGSPPRWPSAPWPAARRSASPPRSAPCRPRSPTARARTGCACCACSAPRWPPAITSGLAVAASRSDAASVVLLLVLAFGAGLLLAGGPSATQVGMAGVAAALVIGHTPQPPGGRRCTSGLLVFAGGAVQTVLAVAAWPLRRHAPERTALAGLYRELAARRAGPAGQRGRAAGRRHPDRGAPDALRARATTTGRASRPIACCSTRPSGSGARSSS